MSTIQASNVSDGTTTLGTSYVVNGSAKAWARVNYSGGTPSSLDSMNVSSYNDDGTGSFDANFTNSMNNSNYSPAGMATGNTRVIAFWSFTTGYIALRVYDIGVTALTLSDSASSFLINGDLA